MKFIEPIDYVPEGWETLPCHPFSAIVDFGKAIDMDGLVSHMKRNGYDESEPIVIFDDSVLDGRHRRHAAIKAEVMPTFAMFVGTEEQALEYAKKKAFRQHPPRASVAMLAASTVTSVRGANQHGEEVTVNDAAKAFGVSGASVKRAKRIIEGGSKLLCDAVEAEKISLADAASIAHLPHKVQNGAVKAIMDGMVSNVRDYAWPICERCREVGSRVEDCKACAAKHESVKEGKLPRLAPGYYKDDAGEIVPDRLRLVFTAVPDFKEAERKLNECAKAFQAIENSAAREAKPLDPEHKHYERFYSVFRNARWRCKNMRPALVCKECGSDGCAVCAEKGWLTVEEAKQKGLL